MLQDCKNNTIKSNYINNNQDYGLYLDSSNETVILGNVFNYNGIDYWAEINSENNKLSWNVINKTISPFIVDEIGNGNFTLTQAADRFAWCIGTGTSSDPYAFQNLIINGLESTNCIEVINSSSYYFRIENCKAYNSSSHNSPQMAGIKFVNVSKGSIIDCNCSNNEGYGIILDKESNNNKISNNLITGNKEGGILINQSNDNTIIDNNIQNNFNNGTTLIQSDFNTIKDNTLNSNEISGVYLQNSHNNTIVANLIKKNIYGVNFTSYPEDNDIIGNIFEDNTIIWYIEKPLNTYSFNLRNGYTDEPIIIDDDGAGNFTWNQAEDQLAWVNGSGTSSNPYVIEDITINSDFVATCIEIKASDAYFVIRNSTFYNARQASLPYAGIHLVNASYGVLYDNIFYNNYKGITLISCDNVNITNNLITSCIYLGISLDDTNYSRIIGNNLTNDQDYGIKLSYSNDNLILNNSISKCDYGIEMQYSENNKIMHNNLSFNFYYGIGFTAGDHNNVANNIITNNTWGGIFIQYSNNTIIYNNTIKHHKGNFQYFGIHIGGSGQECYYNNISSNFIDDNEVGIKLTFNCYYTTVQNNSINGHLESVDNFGIHCSFNVFNSEISGNVINNNRFGIKLESPPSNGNNIYENTIKNNFYGLWSMVDSCNIYGNLILNNFWYGIYLNETANNHIIYKNNFTGNNEHAYDEGTNNQWDNGSIGNYWDDYVSKDIDDDGIGDTIYTNIDGPVGKQDDHPIYWDPPIISLNLPSMYDLYGTIPPQFSISMVEGVQNTVWYSLDNGITNTTASGLTDTIDQIIWNNILNGTATIIFYVDDSRGFIDSTSVIVRKDSVVPTIIINTPQQNDIYSDEPPIFNVEIFDVNKIVSMWYSIVGISTTITFTANGSISQSLWDGLGEGTVRIMFYANDTLGNVANMSIDVMKSTAYQLLDPLIIDDTGAGDYTWAEIAAQVWCIGLGTSSNPYIINRILINGQNSSSCFIIRNSIVHFEIRNSYFGNSGNGNLDAGIRLVNVTNGVLDTVNSSLNNNFGIILVDCSHIIIQNSDIRDNSLGGISLLYSNNNSIINNGDTINNNGLYGIKLNSSLYNIITGNVISNNFYGIFIYRSNNTVIDQNFLITNNRAIEEVESEENNIGEDNTITPIDGGGSEFPIEIVIIIIVIGSVFTLGVAGVVVWKKKVSVKGVKGKLKPVAKKEIKVKEELQKQLANIDKLIRENKHELVMKNLTEIRILAKQNKYLDVSYKAEEKMEDFLNLRLKMIDKIKDIILELGTKYSKLEVAEIIIASEIKDEDMIISTIEGMIHKKEIYGEYDSSSKEIIFNQQTNLDEIDKLMEVHKKWEELNIGKAILPSIKKEVKRKKIEKFSVFLSYSTIDSEYFQVQRIVKDLEFFPEIDKVLYWEADSSRNIVDYMEDTLRKSNIFVLFCSENSSKSGAVKDEWQAAFQLRKKNLIKLIPVYEKEEHVPILLMPLLNVKYTKEDFQGFIQNLYEEILREEF